ncbi:MAG: FAD:protein FMN transferase [Dysgonamonadaceae bacterium]|jgi:thiamine biosynthesis lipoprotein|nr:FAD:protein FMN transferase [Dysgonamonadaceae bacterium]
MKIKKWTSVFLLFCMSLIACKRQMPYFFTEGEIFHTNFHIKYQHNRELSKEIKACLDSFDLSLNPFNKNSIIYKVNHNEDVEIDDWFAAVFNKAQEVSEITGGIYDVTCAPLINLWGFGYEKIGETNQNAIDSVKQFVGYTKVRLDGKKVIKEDMRLQINASSLAKGYACDVIAELFDYMHICNYMVEIGGEIRAKGYNPDNQAWKIEITKPFDDCSGQKMERLEIVQLKDLSLATSGNYRNFYIKDGKKYAHTINPVTGYPSEENILSATVIYPDCMTADAFATAFMALGREKACEIASHIPEMDYLLVYLDANGNFQEEKSVRMEKYLFKDLSQP